MNYNKAVVVGNLTRDPEVRSLPSGQNVASFSVATNRRWTGNDGEQQEETVWFRVTTWGKQAETMAEHLDKGREVYIEGRIENRSYDDKDGNQKYISEIVVQSFQFVGSRDDGDQRQTANTGSETSGELGFWPMASCSL